jgi:excisionase family DNA binding protein
VALYNVTILNLEDQMIHEHEVCETSQSFAAVNGGNTNGSGQFSGRHLLSKGELAAVLGVSPRTIDNWVAQKRIPYLRLSARLIKFDLARVKSALARYEVKEVGAQR